MKQTMTRLLALLLVLSVLFSMVYATQGDGETTDPSEPTEATEATEPSEEPSEPSEEPSEEPTEPSEEPTEPSEPAEPEYVFPDDWSRDALVFAVENKILMGDENYNLNASNRITRAEMAAVLVRLLGAKGEADLSQYKDVDPAAWYYKELSAAVEVGIFSGIDETQMWPTSPITREQTMAVLCRAFGLVSQNRETYKEFPDHANVMAYARDNVSVMRELGMVAGYEDGTLLPKNTITRAEVAQLIYMLFDCIADTPEDVVSEGTVLYRGTEALPATLEIDGRLILAHGLTELEIDSWSITESLVIRTAGSLEADLSGLTSRQLVIAADGSFKGNVEELWLWGNATYEGDAHFLGCVSGAPVANGNYETVEVRGGRLSADGDIGTVNMDANTSFLCGGTAKSITCNGANGFVGGMGSAELVTILAGGCDVQLKCDKLDNTWWETYGKEYTNALKTVQTMQVACKVEQDTFLCRYQNLTGYMIALPKGATVYNEWHPAGDVFYVSYIDSDGKKWYGWTDRWACYIPDDTVTTNGELDYSVATKEGFVNLMNYDSKTEYLVWLSRYTQKVIVFQGYQGNWKVIKTMPCSSGANNTPTPEGIYEIYDRTGRWNFDQYYANSVSIFSGGHAFHSVLYGYNDELWDGRVGIPLSHGCVRMLNEDCQYIYSLPRYTRVIVY